MADTKAHDDGFTVDTTELARCAQCNVDNLALMAPALAAHPVYSIAKAQLDAVVARLEAADASAA